VPLASGCARQGSFTGLRVCGKRGAPAAPPARIPTPTESPTPRAMPSGKRAGWRCRQPSCCASRKRWIGGWGGGAWKEAGGRAAHGRLCAAVTAVTAVDAALEAAMIGQPPSPGAGGPGGWLRRVRVARARPPSAEGPGRAAGLARTQPLRPSDSVLAKLASNTASGKTASNTASGKTASNTAPGVSYSFNLPASPPSAGPPRRPAPDRAPPPPASAKPPPTPPEHHRLWGIRAAVMRPRGAASSVNAVRASAQPSPTPLLQRHRHRSVRCVARPLLPIPRVGVAPAPPDAQPRPAAALRPQGAGPHRSAQRKPAPAGTRAAVPCVRLTRARSRW
jgi:hypothetical protein